MLGYLYVRGSVSVGAFSEGGGFFKGVGVFICGGFCECCGI